MRTIKLLDARRALDRKCKELFTDSKIADSIFRYLCKEIDECDCKIVPETTVEPLTDTEQRIFLSMIDREVEYCKMLDRLWCKMEIESEIDLVPVCQEIKRKVKNALWTN